MANRTPTDRTEYFRQYHIKNRSKRIRAAARWARTHPKQTQEYKKKWNDAVTANKQAMREKLIFEQKGL